MCPELVATRAAAEAVAIAQLCRRQVAHTQAAGAPTAPTRARAHTHTHTHKHIPTEYRIEASFARQRASIASECLSDGRV